MAFYMTNIFVFFFLIFHIYCTIKQEKKTNAMQTISFSNKVQY